MSTHNLKKYKLAKVLVKELTIIVEIMLQYESKLNKYSKFSPINKLVNNTKENRIILQHHLKRQREIVKLKGMEIETPLLIGDKK